MNPKKGAGERDLECRLYEDCLSKAGLLNWRSFHCESCPLFQSIHKLPATTKQENERMCSECGSKKTISPNSTLCASCMARRSNKKRPSSKKTLTSFKTKETIKGQDKHKAEIGQSRANFEIVFSGKYRQVLKEVEKLAEEEIRSTEEQIVFILKNYLKGIK